MKKNKIIYFLGGIAFLGLVGYSLNHELSRGLKEIRNGISGTIHVKPGVGAGIIKTDHAYVLLFDEEMHHLVANHIINPFLPPITFFIGAEHAELPLKDSERYRMLVVTDKDGNLGRVTRGEVIGEVTEPIALGAEEFQYTITRDFQGNLPHALRAQPPVAIGK